MKREPVKFVDLDIQPATQTPGPGSFQAILAELKEQPGRWAEIDRYELKRIASARSRGSNCQKRYPGVEYAVIDKDGEAILYMRWRPE